jgi:hypothetical protein
VDAAEHEFEVNRQKAEAKRRKSEAKRRRVAEIRDWAATAPALGERPTEGVVGRQQDKDRYKPARESRPERPKPARITSVVTGGLPESNK